MQKARFLALFDTVSIQVLFGQNLFKLLTVFWTLKSRMQAQGAMGKIRLKRPLSKYEHFPHSAPLYMNYSITQLVQNEVTIFF